ncbi:MAG: DUF5686 family protein [Bacteroidia bacterium]
MNWLQLVTLWVLDPDSKPLSYAVGEVRNTGFTFVTNTEGKATLQLFPGTYTLSFRYVGYRNQTVNFSLRGDTTLHITLYPQDVRLPTVLLTEGKQDFARWLIRQAIRAKKNHAIPFPSYSVEAYALYFMKEKKLPKWVKKQAGLQDTSSILFLSEAYSRIYFQEPQQIREEMLYSRIIGQKEYSPLGEYLFRRLDPYGERLSFGSLTPTEIVLPLARDALLYYDYKLVGETGDPHKPIYLVEATPKSAQILAPVALLYVEDESFALTGWQWHFAKQLKYLDTLTFQATYTLHRGKYVPQSIRAQAVASLFALTHIEVYLEGSALYKNYVVYGPPTQPRKTRAARQMTPPSSVSDSLPPAPRIDFKERLYIAPEATQLPSPKWDSLRPMVLDKTLHTLTQQHDSLLNRQDTFSSWQFQPTLAYPIRLRYQKPSGYFQAGIHLPFYTELEKWSSMALFTLQKENLGYAHQLDALFRFGQAGKKFGRISYQLDARKGPFFSLKTHIQYYPLQPSLYAQIGELDNTLLYLIERRNYIDLYAVSGAGLSFQTRVIPAIQLTTGVQYFQGLPTSTERKSYTALRMGVEALIQPRTKYMTLPEGRVYLPKARTPLILLSCQYAHTPKPIFLMEAEVKQIFSLSPLGSLELRGSGGMVWHIDSLPWAEGLFPLASPPFWNTPYFLYARLPYYTAYPYYLNALVAWDDEGLLLRYIPVLRKLGLYQIFAGKALYSTEKPYYEITWNIGMPRKGFIPGLYAGISIGNNPGISWTVGVGSPRRFRLIPSRFW